MKKSVLLYSIFIFSFSLYGQVSKTLVLPDYDYKQTVGTTTYYLSDKSRADIASPEKYHREISIQLWYPAIKDNKAKKAHYINQFKEYSTLVGTVYNDRFPRVDNQVSFDLKIKNKNHPYPVVFFSPGFGMSKSYYTSLYKFLVNQGYIVVSIDHTYLNKTVSKNGKAINPSNGYWDSFPATKSPKDPEKATEELLFAYNYFSQDLEFVFSQLKKINENDPKGIFNNSFDLNNIASLGHSGGAIATKGAMMKENNSFKAYVTYDVRLDREYLSATKWVEIPNKTKSPILMFNLEYVQQYKPFPNEQFIMNHKNDFVYAALKGMNHSSLSDLDYLKHLDKNDSVKLEKTKKDMLRIFQTTTIFLDSHLKK